MDDAAGTLIVQLRSHGKDDHTPMQMISAARLAYYKRMEAEALYLRKVVKAVRLAVVSDFSDSEAANPSEA